MARGKRIAVKIYYVRIVQNKPTVRNKCFEILSRKAVRKRQKKIPPQHAAPQSMNIQNVNISR